MSFKVVLLLPASLS